MTSIIPPTQAACNADTSVSFFFFNVIRTCVINGQWGLMGINNVPLRLLDTSVAKICILLTFWPVIQLIEIFDEMYERGAILTASLNKGSLK